MKNADGTHDGEFVDLDFFPYDRYGNYIGEMPVKKAASAPIALSPLTVITNLFSEEERLLNSLSGSL